MRAGEHHDVGPPPVLLDEAGLDLGAHGLLLHEAVPHVGLGERGELARCRRAAHGTSRPTA